MEHATPKLDVAETKPDGNDILNKLRAPPVVADEAKLAIVFTYFFFFFLPLLLLNQFGEMPVSENLFPPIFWNN